MTINAIPGVITEVGSWTPTLLGSTTNPTVGYGANVSGSYLKLGTTVFVSGVMQVSTIVGGSGNALIGGLPYAAAASPQSARGAFSIVNSTGFTSTTTPDGMLVSLSAQTAQLYRKASADARDSDNTLQQVSEMPAALQFFFQGWYTTP